VLDIITIQFIVVTESASSTYHLHAIKEFVHFNFTNNNVYCARYIRWCSTLKITIEINFYKVTMAINEQEINTHLPPELFLIHKQTKPNGLPILMSADSDCYTGFDNSLIVGYDEKSPFICSICKGLPRYPIELAKCGHVFCYDCISHVKGSLDDNGVSLPKKCPNCRSAFKKSDITHFEKSSMALYQIYSKYVLRCPYECGHVSSPKEMIEHQTWKCKSRPVMCTSKGCHIVLADDQMETHLQNCTKRFVFCNKCRIPMIVNNKEHKCVSQSRNTVRCMQSLLCL